MAFQIEDEISHDELKREFRRMADEYYGMQQALRDLPEIPSRDALAFIAAGRLGRGEDWGIGVRMQGAPGGETIPHKSEYEMAAGFWSRMRAGLVAPRPAS